MQVLYLKYNIIGLKHCLTSTSVEQQIQLYFSDLQHAEQAKLVVPLISHKYKHSQAAAGSTSANAL